MKDKKSIVITVVIIGIFIGFSVAALSMRDNSIVTAGVDSIKGRKENKAASIDYESLTLENDLIPGEIPTLYQLDKRWKDFGYGDGIMELKGCAPTCLSMVASGLLNDETLTPVKIAQKSEKWGYVGSFAGTSWEIMSEGAKKLGLSVEEVPLDENKMRNELEDGKIIICAMVPGDFTTEGHFIVLTGYNEQEGGFIVHDPNSEENTKKVWPYSVIEFQIRNIWSFEKK